MPNRTLQRNMLWNAIGTLIFCFSQWLMTILVVRLSRSYEEAGIYGLANSICNIFSMVSIFSVRNYQITDIDNEFSSGEYISLRYITSVLSLLLLLIYLIIARYPVYTSGTVLCFMFLKLSESLIDVFHGIFQKAWRYDVICKSFLIRSIANTIVFAISEYVSKNLIISLFSTAIVSLICALSFDIKKCFLAFEIKIKFKNIKILKLALLCLPLFFHGLLLTFISNMPRLAAERILGEEMLGVYISVATPTIIVQVASASFFNPCITLLSKQFKHRNKKIFQTILIVQIIVILIGICAIVCSVLMGDKFLNLIFGNEILEYSYLLIPTVIVSTLSATVSFLTGVFTVIKKNNIMVALEIFISLFTVAASYIMISVIGIKGINLTLIISYGMFIVIGYLIIVKNIFKYGIHT